MTKTKASQPPKLFEVIFSRTFTVDERQDPTRSITEKEAEEVARKTLKEELDTNGQDTCFETVVRTFEIGQNGDRKLVQKPAALSQMPVGQHKK